jgi:hypothetical protein
VARKLVALDARLPFHVTEEVSASADGNGNGEANAQPRLDEGKNKSDLEAARKRLFDSVPVIKCKVSSCLRLQCSVSCAHFITFPFNSFTPAGAHARERVRLRLVRDQVCGNGAEATTQILLGEHRRQVFHRAPSKRVLAAGRGPGENNDAAIDRQVDKRGRSATSERMHDN